MTKLADPATWYRALYLPERVRLRDPADEDTGAPSDRACRRALRWKESFPLDSPGFARRLRSDGLDEDELAPVLDDPGDDIIAQLTRQPPWLAEVLAAYAGAPAELTDLPEPSASHELVGLMTTAAPLLNRARARLRRVLERLHQQRPEPRLGVAYEPAHLLAELFAPLPGLMLRMLARTMILELHGARLSGQLDGDTPEARYQAFVAALASPERVLALYEEYPVLARCLAETAARWETVMGEFAERLAADWPALVQTFFGGEPPGPVVEIHTSAGDAHRGGRAVMILRFASGARLVYKPRSLLVDRRFQELLAWLDQRGSHPRFRTLRLLEREEYGWVEFIEHRACESREQAARFFERQGAYLALFHALEATDIHYENLIAHGEHPVPVDLESLFQPRAELEHAGSELRAAEKMGMSVLRVGLLPSRRYTDEIEEELDLSGLSSVKGQLTPEKQHFFEGAGTDELRMVRRRLPMGEGRNLPMLGGQELSVLAHERDFLRGFTGMYRLLVEHRDELLASDGPLASFAEVPIRIILRPTRVYAALLRESFHPDLMRDALDRDRHFDRLWEIVDSQPRLWQAIPSEIEDLRQGDIPAFTGQPSARHITDARGTVLENMIEQPGFARARARIAGFGDDDLREQVWFVQSSLATMAMSLEDSAMASYPARPGAREAGGAELVAAARAVGDRLCALAIAGEHDLTWIGMAVNHEKWILDPLKNEMYAGLPGVILFLAYLGACTGEGAYTEVAARAHRTLTDQIDSDEHKIFAPGAFNGWAGIIYLQVHLALLWDRPDLLDAALEVAERLPPMVAEDTRYDVLYGAAGAIAGLLLLHRARSAPRLLDMAVTCGDRLLAGARPGPRGISWVCSADEDRALAGFSHGAAGIAWALSHLAAATGEGRFRDSAAAALTFEREVFSPEAGNWPDLRTPLQPLPPGTPETPRFMCAWCHGAAGIGMARLDMPGFDGDPERAREIDIAVETTRTRGFGSNHTLCHGDLGNLELLLLAARRRGDPALHSAVYRRARGILDSIEAHGWLSGVPLGVETPGLMNGLAGIGYELLRLADPGRVPSVLVLAPPPALAGMNGS